MYSYNPRDTYPEGQKDARPFGLEICRFILLHYPTIWGHHYHEQDTFQEFDDGQVQQDAPRWLELRSTNRASCLSHLQIRCWAMSIKTVKLQG